MTEPPWIKSILDDPTASTRMKYVASQARSYGDGHRKFIHLLDGGITDNLGLRGALDRAIAREQYASVPSVPWKIPRRVAIIVVDAHTDSDYGWDSQEHSIGWGALLSSLGSCAVRAARNRANLVRKNASILMAELLIHLHNAIVIRACAGSPQNPAKCGTTRALEGLSRQ